MKAVLQQRQDILRAHAFEALDRAIAIDESLFVAVQKAMKTVGRRKFPPEVLDDEQSLGQR